ncbi:hypothetical protein ACPOLB_21890 [Rubrivivax sp. RP6-9]|uniref:hypothetical protein n=1 Tax=Rubrivivax sp. RP6-9 TaxID=3415750 RepID=UPI003CC5F62F
MKTSKPRKVDPPWSFIDGPAVADRILREYAQRLLDSLPHIPDDTICTNAKVKGYRMLTYALVTAARAPAPKPPCRHLEDNRAPSGQGS